MSVPHWRYVHYTDDGCAIYQCLNCYNKWESRTAPGWYNPFMGVDEPVEGCMSFTQGDTIKYYVKRDEPLYQEGWKFCPHCACEWDGAIVPDCDNDRMLQGRRLRVYRLERDLPYRSSESDWYWVIQDREVWQSRDEPEEWKSVKKCDPRRYSAIEMFKELQERREYFSVETRGQMFPVITECRVIKITREDAERTCRWL